jgi:hypothetical protein
MLMLRPGPRDGKHDRRGAKPGPDKHRPRPPPIDLVPLVTHDKARRGRPRLT